MIDTHTRSPTNTVSATVRQTDRHIFGLLLIHRGIHRLCIMHVHNPSVTCSGEYLWRMHSHADLFRPHWRKSNHRPEQAQGTNNFPGPGHNRNRLEGTSCWHTSCLIWRRKRTVRFHRLQLAKKRNLCERQTRRYTCDFGP